MMTCRVDQVSHSLDTPVGGPRGCCDTPNYRHRQLTLMPADFTIFAHFPVESG
jgi:hypothetical protein